jgi:pimeloyl-ACP methyl ester carboxylesterase
MPVHVLPDGAAMSYAEAGAGAPFVLVHGWAANGAFFTDLAAALSRTRRVFTLTLRGHPGSEPGQSPLTIETLAEDLVHFAETLDLKNAVALGWSMGAMTLWSAASRLNQRLAGIVIEDMGPRLVNDETWAHGISTGYSAANVADTVSEIEADWPAYVARFAPRLFSASARDAAPELVAWAAEQMAKANPQAMSSFWTSMARQDFRPTLPSIATPTLVIHGAESEVYDDGATAFVAEAAPNARRVVISGAGHIPHLEAPNHFLNHIEAFVRDLREPNLKSGGAVP